MRNKRKPCRGSASSVGSLWLQRWRSCFTMPDTAHSERLTRAHRISRRHDASPTKPLARHALTSWVRGGASWVMKREARVTMVDRLDARDRRTPASESLNDIKTSCPPGRPTPPLQKPARHARRGRAGAPSFNKTHHYQPTFINPTGVHSLMPWDSTVMIRTSECTPIR